MSERDMAPQRVWNGLRVEFTRHELTLLDADLQGAANHYRDKVRRYEGAELTKIGAEGLRKRRERAARLERLREVIRAANPTRTRTSPPAERTEP